MLIILSMQQMRFSASSSRSFGRKEHLFYKTNFEDPMGIFSK